MFCEGQQSKNGAEIGPIFWKCTGNGYQLCKLGIQLLRSCSGPPFQAVKKAPLSGRLHSASFSTLSSLSAVSMQGNKPMFLLYSPISGQFIGMICAPAGGTVSGVLTVGRLDRSIWNLTPRPS